MTQFRYSASSKVAAVRRVVEDGHSVRDVAREIGVGEGSLFFWVRRCRELAPGMPLPLMAEVQSAANPGSLVAYLRRATGGQSPPIPVRQSNPSRI